MNYHSILPDIVNSLPEIMGAILLSPDNQILINKAQQIGPIEDLEGIAGRIQSIHRLAASRFDDVNAIQIGFKGINICSRLLGDGNRLIIFHQPELTPAMLRMAIQFSLSADGKKEEESSLPEEEMGAPESTADEDTPAGPDPEAIVASLLAPESDLAKPLTAIKDELAKYIGPAADPILSEKLVDWITAQQPSLAELGGLISILALEIDDPQEMEMFKTFSLKFIPQQEQ